MPQLVQSYNYVLPFNNYNGSPEYIITDPYSSWFYNVDISPGTYTDTLSLANEKLSSGNYGILYEESGMILMEKGYTGKAKQFIPYEVNAMNNSVINFMPPGNYSVHSNANITLICNNRIYQITSENGNGSFILKNYINNVKILFNSTQKIIFIQQNYSL